MSLLNSLRAPIIGSISLLGAIVLLQSFAQAQSDNKEQIAKGQYIFALAGGCAFHTVPKGTPHAGGRAFSVPFRTVFSTNNNQDKETRVGWLDGFANSQCLHTRVPRRRPPNLSGGA